MRYRKFMRSAVASGPVRPDHVVSYPRCSAWRAGSPAPVRGRCITVIITYRAAAAQAADRIVVLADGRIVAVLVAGTVWRRIHRGLV